MPLKAAVKLVAVETSEEATVSANDSHQRKRRSAVEGQSISSSEHSAAPGRQAMKKNLHGKREQRGTAAKPKQAQAEVRVRCHSFGRMREAH
jgi:hypothetical protein